MSQQRIREQTLMRMSPLTALYARTYTASFIINGRAHAHQFHVDGHEKLDKRAFAEIELQILSVFIRSVSWQVALHITQVSQAL